MGYRKLGLSSGNVSCPDSALLLVAIALGLFWLWGSKPKPDSLVPPPDKLPTASDTLQIVDQVSFQIDLYLWQNFMPSVPQSGPPFYLSLEMEVKNLGKKKMVGFKPELLTLYPEDSKKPLRTFKLVSADPEAPVEIAPHKEEYFTYTNDRTETFSPKLKQGDKFYARILVVWNGKKRILTSPAVPVEFTY